MRDVALAACLWYFEAFACYHAFMLTWLCSATNVLRACPSLPHSNHTAKGLITTLKGLLQSGQQPSTAHKAHACFIIGQYIAFTLYRRQYHLYIGHLIVDQVEYSRIAFEFGILDLLVEPIREHIALVYDEESEEILAEDTIRLLEVPVFPFS